MHSVYLEKIKTFEGFTPEAKPDYSQYSNGYGTRALYPGERIDRAEAERRFASEIARAREFVEQHVPSLDEGTKAALTSLTFNAGTRWASSGLGEAARHGDLDAVRERFVQYTKAGGKELPGLVTRRLAEATWIGSGHYAGGQSTVAALQPKVHEPTLAAVASQAASPVAIDAPSQTSPLLSAAPHSAPRFGGSTAEPSPVTKFILAMAALELAGARIEDDERRSERAARA